MKLRVLPEEKVLKLISHLSASQGVFLETAYFNKEEARSFLFIKPKEVLIYSLGQDLDEFFEKINSKLSSGFWLAGYFSYEFGYLFEDSLREVLNPKELIFPLVWLGVFKKPLIIEHWFLKKKNASLTLRPPKIKEGFLNMKFPEYKKAVEKIKNYLKRGQTYQVNFTLKYKAKFEGSLLNLYLFLRRAQPTSYASFINDGEEFILSFSPELFFRLKKSTILTRPMKGTYKRGRFSEEDRANAAFLKNDLKNRAENLMIVDLIRNDLGKIAFPGSVRVRSLFDIERYPSLFQMTSTIGAKLKKDVDLEKIFEALFPSGSVTGAPKIRTMQIIKELEKEPRKVYTGSIGFISPQKEACFNVAIRTLILKEGTLELGVGGGIVYDSKPKREYEESLLKAAFLIRPEISFSLIETILYKEGNYWLLKYHLKRLKESSFYFDIPLDWKLLKKELSGIAKKFSPDKKYKVRILVDRRGKIKISYSLLKDINEPVLLKLSSQKIDPSNIFLYHKTTQRKFYEEERRKALREGFFEVIFTNKKGELTEGSISNIFLLNKDKLYTPPLACGLLRGVLREHLLRKGKAKEKILYLEDLLKAKEVFIGNSLRGLIKAKINL